MTLLNIGQVAKQTGITVEAVRFYEKQGLIDVPLRSEAGYRKYPPETVKRVQFIQNAKDVGFTLKDVGELLTLRSKPKGCCGDVKERALKKIDDVDQKITDLVTIRDALSLMVEKCNIPHRGRDCAMIEELEVD